MFFYEEVLKAFHKEKIKYILVGGVAANLLGTMRSTADLDILVEMSDDDLKKNVGILERRGYCLKQPVDPMGIADKKTRKDRIGKKQMKKKARDVDRLDVKELEAIKRLRKRL